MLCLLTGCNKAHAKEVKYVKPKKDHYIAEWYIQQVNHLHSYTQVPWKNENDIPAFLTTYDSKEDSGYSEFLNGMEGKSIDLTGSTFKTRNGVQYIIDSKNNCYYKLPDNLLSEGFFWYNKMIQILHENFITDTHIQNSLDSENIQTERSYERDYHARYNEVLADFATYSNCEIIKDGVITVFSTTKDSSHKQTETVFEKVLSEEKFTEDFFTRSEAILHRDFDILVPEELATLSKEQLRILRNEIYAKRGRSFQSEDLQEYFNQKKWYKIDKKYSDEKLSIFDLRNIEIIQRVENK